MSYVVKWVKPEVKYCDKLKAVTTDFIHGVANCSFPISWNGLSRTFLGNEGRIFEVKNLTWNGKYYELNKEDIMREIILEKDETN